MAFLINKPYHPCARMHQINRISTEINDDLGQGCFAKIFEAFIMFMYVSVNICKRPASGIQDSKCLVLSCSAAGLVHSKNMLDNRDNT